MPLGSVTALTIVVVPSGARFHTAPPPATETEIMNQTGHESLPVLRRYIRRGRFFNDNAAAKLGP